MRASVIIPVYDDYEGLKQCLALLAAQTLPLSDFEVLVVDNGTPRDRVPTLTGRFGALQVIQLRCETPGSYSARNVGLANARADRLAFTDADCLPIAGWLEAGLQTLATLGPEGGLVGGPVEVFARDPHAPTLAELWELERAFPQERYLRELHFSVTANAFTTRAVIERVGTFNADLKSGGDREFGERVWAAGLPLVYEPRALMRHPARHTMRALLNKTKRATRGDIQRQQLQQPWDAARRARELSYIGLALATPGARAAQAAWRVQGPLSKRARFAVADTTVHLCRKLIFAQALWDDLRKR